MAMTVRIVEEERWASTASELLAEQLARKPDALVSFPTGRTPLPFYAELRRRAAADPAPFRSLRAVMLDDYLGAGALPSNFYRWLRRELFDGLNLGDDRLLRIPTEPDGACGGNLEMPRAERASPAANRSPPSSDQRERPSEKWRATLDAACAAFERGIAAWGGCDLQFLGLGGNGHVGFNDPGSPADSRTRVVELAPETARANAAYWSTGFIPTRAVTMGIATILAARQICLLVRGSAKAETLRRALHGPVGPEAPASFLQRAPDLIVIADVAAAGRL